MIKCFDAASEAHCLVRPCDEEVDADAREMSSSLSAPLSPRTKAPHRLRPRCCKVYLSLTALPNGFVTFLVLQKQAPASLQHMLDRPGLQLASSIVSECRRRHGGNTLHHRVGRRCSRRLALGKGVRGKILQCAWAEAVWRIWLHVGGTAELQVTHDFATCHGPYVQTTAAFSCCMQMRHHRTCWTARKRRPKTSWSLEVVAGSRKP